MWIKHSVVVQWLSFVAIVALAWASETQGQNGSLGKLFVALDRPVQFEEGISKWPLQKVLDQLRQKNNLEFVIDTDAFEKELDRKDVAKCKVSFDRVSGIPTSLFLDMLLRQINAHFETRDGKIRIVPVTDQHSVYHPACLPSREERRKETVRSKLQKPVTLAKGLDSMTFGEAKAYFEDRFDLSILVDQGLFPKADERVTERSVELPCLQNIPLEQVLKSLLAQAKATMEIRGGAVLVVPKEPEK
jgi:hypothetical protein